LRRIYLISCVFSTADFPATRFSEYQTTNQNLDLILIESSAQKLINRVLTRSVEDAGCSRLSWSVADGQLHEVCAREALFFFALQEHRSSWVGGEPVLLSGTRYVGS
jgi:hypothetical protein